LVAAAEASSAALAGSVNGKGLAPNQQIPRKTPAKYFKFMILKDKRIDSDASFIFDAGRAFPQNNGQMSGDRFNI